MMDSPKTSKSAKKKSKAKAAAKAAKAEAAKAEADRKAKIEACKAVIRAQQSSTNNLGGQKMVLDDETLKLFLECGCKITKVHRILRHNKPATPPVITATSTPDEVAISEFYAEGMRNKSVFGRELINQMEKKSE